MATPVELQADIAKAELEVAYAVSLAVASARSLVTQAQITAETLRAVAVIADRVAPLVELAPASEAYDDGSTESLSQVFRYLAAYIEQDGQITEGPKLGSSFWFRSVLSQTEEAADRVLAGLPGEPAS